MISRSSFLAGVALFMNAAAVTAQQISVPAADHRRNGCTGFAYRVTMSSEGPLRPVAMTLTGVDSISPAARAGLRSGDVVTHINGEPITDGRIGRHWDAPPGTLFRLRVRRAQREFVAEFPSGRRASPPAGATATSTCAPVGRVGGPGTSQ